MTVFLKLCTRVPDEEVPAKYLARAREIQARRGHRDIVQFYKIPTYCQTHMKRSNNRAILWKEHNLTKRGLSREALQRISTEIADECYPKRRGRALPKKGEDFQLSMENILNQLVHGQGYATEQQILEFIPGSYENNKTRLKRCLNESLLKYGYTRIRSTKELKKQYNVLGNGYPFLIVKE